MKLPVPQGSHAVALCAELTGQLRWSMHWERHPPASEQPQNAATEMLTPHSGITICDLLQGAKFGSLQGGEGALWSWACKEPGGRAARCPPPRPPPSSIRSR